MLEDAPTGEATLDASSTHIESNGAVTFAQVRLSIRQLQRFERGFFIQNLLLLQLTKQSGWTCRSAQGTTETASQKSSAVVPCSTKD